MKQISPEQIEAILNGIIMSEMPSKFAQSVAGYLREEFAKLPEVKTETPKTE